MLLYLISILLLLSIVNYCLKLVSAFCCCPRPVVAVVACTVVACCPVLVLVLVIDYLYINYSFNCLYLLMLIYID